MRTALLAGVALASGAARASPRIGVLLPVPDTAGHLAALREGLRDVGWGDAVLVVRQADGTVAAFERLGRELTALSVDMLVTASTAAASALARVTATIPIVFVGTFDPVAAGLVASLDRPGGNLTGIAGLRADIAAQWASHLREIAPRVRRALILSNPASIAPAALASWLAAARLGGDTGEVRVETAAGIDEAVATVAMDAGAGIIVVPHTFPFANRRVLIDAMARHRVPAIYGIAEMVRSGGLVSYGQDLVAQWRMAALYLVRIASGARPADLPARYATRHPLTINTRAAAALGLAVPPAMLARADEIVS